MNVTGEVPLVKFTGIETGIVSWADWIAIALLYTQYIITALQGIFQQQATRNYIKLALAFRASIHIINVFTLIILLENQGFSTAVSYLGTNMAIEIIAIALFMSEHMHSKPIIDWFLKDRATGQSAFRHVMWCSVFSVALTISTLLLLGLTPPLHTPMGNALMERAFTTFAQPTKAAGQGFTLAILWAALSFLPSAAGLCGGNDNDDFDKKAIYFALRSIISGAFVYMLASELRVFTEKLVTKDTASVLLVLDAGFGNLMNLFLMYLKTKEDKDKDKDVEEPLQPQVVKL